MADEIRIPPSLSKSKISNFCWKIFVVAIISVIFGTSIWASLSDYKGVLTETEYFSSGPFRQRRSIIPQGDDDGNSFNEYNSIYLQNRHKSNAKRRVKKVLDSDEYWELRTPGSLADTKSKSRTSFRVMKRRTRVKRQAR